MRAFHSKPVMAFELLFVMVGIPVVLYWLVLPRAILPTIWLMALYCHVIVRRLEGAPTAFGWGGAALTWANIQPILIRFAICAVALTGATVVWAPNLLLGFVTQTPLFWALIMVLYPLLSVVPQEIIFRVYFFSRYKALFPTPAMMVLGSALTFGLAHIIFHNAVAPVLCAAGGLIFASTYRKHRSLLLVAFEHALYGDFLFTLGLGRYFYHGAIAAAAAH